MIHDVSSDFWWCFKTRYSGTWDPGPPSPAKANRTRYTNFYRQILFPDFPGESKPPPHLPTHLEITRSLKSFVTGMKYGMRIHCHIVKRTLIQPIIMIENLVCQSRFYYIIYINWLCEYPYFQSQAGLWFFRQ